VAKRAEMDHEKILLTGIAEYCN